MERDTWKAPGSPPLGAANDSSMFSRTDGRERRDGEQIAAERRKEEGQEMDFCNQERNLVQIQ